MTAVGWNWTNSRSASVAPGGARQQQPRAERARRVGGARPQRRGAARGEHDRARRAAPAVVACRGPRSGRRASSRSAAARRPSSTSMRGCSATTADSSRRIRRPVALPPACATRRREWPPSSPSARLPWRSASKRTPSASRSRKRSGASAQSTRAALRRTSPRPGLERVLLVLLGRVVGRERGGEPALGPVGRRLGQRPGGDERDAGALAGGGQGRVEAGGAGAHDDEVGPLHGKPVRYPGAPDRLAAPRRCRSPTTSPATPSARSGSSRSRPRWSATTGSAASACEAPEATQEQPARASTRSAHVALHRGAVRGRRRPRSTWTRSRSRRPTRRRCARPAAASRSSTRCSSGEAATGFSALRPPGHHAEPDRAMGFCFFGNAAVAARHARVGARRRARADPRLGRPPRQRDERDLPRRPERAVRLDPRVAAVSRHGAGERPRLGRGGGLHGQPARARPARATRRSARWSTTSSCR